jgi:hypothetical protein
MIEQTGLVVIEWHYHQPVNNIDAMEKILEATTLDVMRKRASTKKGIACRFSCRFVYDNETILDYVTEDSYVIDLADTIDKNELLTMLRNSYSKFKATFDLRKLGTVLQDKSLRALDETKIDLDAIVPLLV